MSDVTFRRELNEQIAERLFGWRKIAAHGYARPIYEAPEEEGPASSAADKTYIWVQTGDHPMTALDFTTWAYAGHVIGKLLPSLSPAQFLVEFLAAFNWTPQDHGTVSILPLEAGSNVFAQYQADGVLTPFGIFCRSYPNVPPVMWKRIVEHLAGLTLADLATHEFWEDLYGGLNTISNDNAWMAMFENSQNNAVPEEKA